MPDVAFCLEQDPMIRIMIWRRLDPKDQYVAIALHLMNTGSIYGTILHPKDVFGWFDNTENVEYSWEASDAPYSKLGEWAWQVVGSTVVALGNLEDRDKLPTYQQRN